MNVILLDASSPRWGSEVERIGVELGAGYNSKLFPYHFLYVTLSKIGGYIALFEQDGRRHGVGFLFPRGLDRSANQLRRAYTLRYHSLLAPETPTDTAGVTAACGEALGGDSSVVFYDPYGPHTFERTGEEIGPVEFGRPSATEAEALRKLQQQVWGSPPEFLYPSDIHSREFAAGSSIVARVEGIPAGFLFGFAFMVANCGWSPKRWPCYPRIGVCGSQACSSACRRSRLGTRALVLFIGQPTRCSSPMRR
jgi:hypothetical protein